MANFKNFSIRLGHPCPVFKSKWGLERVQGLAIINFEPMQKTQMCIKKIYKRIAIDVLLKAYPTIPLSGDSELVRRYL